MRRTYFRGFRIGAPWVATAVVLVCVSAQAQWLNYPTPGIPRTAGGKPDLTAPAPRAPDGKPDLSGLWQRSADKYYNNIAADLKAGEVAAWADALYQQRKVQFGRDSMETQCLPMGPAIIATPYRDSKIVQTPALVVILNDDLTYRQVFMDGRNLEKNPNPAWMGYSVGHWEADTLVVESAGYNDRTWLDFDGHPHSENLHVTERYTRRDFGHMQVVATFEDSKVEAHSWTISVLMELEPDTEMLEFVCENERDRAHISSAHPELKASAGVQIAPETLVRYAGVYEIRGRDKTEILEITVSGDSVYWELERQGKQRLTPLSQTAFSLSGTLVEFAVEKDGSVDHLIIQEVEGETKGVRKR